MRPGEARSDLEIMAGMFTRMRTMYARHGGAFPDPILNLTWKYAQVREPEPRRAREGILRQCTEGPCRSRRTPTKITRKAGEQLAGFAELRNDGSTQSGCWIFCGAWGPTGNLMARRDNSDPTGIGQTLNWAWAWPANRRVLYNRASCDPSRQALEPEPQADWLERHGLGRRRRPGLQGRRESGRRHESVHHESRRAWRACSRDRTWLKGRSRSTTSRSRHRSATIR